MLVLPQLVIYIPKDNDLTLEILNACHIATLMLLAAIILLFKTLRIMPNDLLLTYFPMMYG